jgi:hypothetical protein
MTASLRAAEFRHRDLVLLRERNTRFDHFSDRLAAFMLGDLKAKVQATGRRFSTAPQGSRTVVD